jgi:hypothetical protein
MTGMKFVNGRMFVPFSKIDKERRMVWGIAQSEVPDSQGDLIDYEASVRAFSKWSGCIREMHDDKKAVGRKVEIKCDPVSKTIAVGAYISKGAQDTWEKVLDGTLNGYSIGGYPIKTGPINKFGQNLRRLSEYGLDELSLVDQPSNPECKFTAIQKRGSALIATNILGAVRPEDNGMRTKTRSKIGNLVAFTKALGADDEVVVVRKTDFVRLNDGRFALKKDAAVTHFAKADLDADGYDDSADDTAPDDTSPVSKADASGHAQNALDSHDDWHKVAGQTECNCDRDEDAPEIKGKDDEADDETDVTKNATRRRRRRDALRKGNLGALTKSAAETLFTGMFADFAKSFDEKFAKLGTGGDPAPRQSGTLQKRDDGSEIDPNDAVAVNAASIVALHKKRDEFLKKGSSGLSDQDRSERLALAKEIANAETEQLKLTGATAR